MRVSSILALSLLSLVAGCAADSSIKPAEVMDERTGVTIGALQEPIEFVADPQAAPAGSTRRTSFAYLGPIEWDRMGEITYGLWIHLAPGNDHTFGDIRAKDAVMLHLDGATVTLASMAEPGLGHGPYQPVASWGQTAYFALDVGLLKRMAASQAMRIDFRSPDGSAVAFTPTRDTHGTLVQFLSARGITDD